MDVLVAVDPGVSVGFAARIEDGTYLTATCSRPEELWSFIQQAEPKHCVVETFARSNRIDANMIATMEMVGGVKALCWALGIRIHTQSPQMRYSFLDTARAYIVAHRPKGFTQYDLRHEADALAHVMTLAHRLDKGLEK